MNWKTLAVSMGALTILPLSIYATEPHQVKNIQETDNMGHYSQKARFGKKGDRGQKMGKLLQQLDLTSEQSQQIETIQEQSRSDAQGLKERLQTQHQEMRSLMASDADIEQIREKHQETQELHQQLSGNRFETMLQIREVLTLEQRSKMAELMPSHRGRRPEI